MCIFVGCKGDWFKIDLLLQKSHNKSLYILSQDTIIIICILHKPTIQPK